MINQILEIIKTNQVLLAGLGLGGAGLLTFCLREFPKYIIEIIKRELTTSLTITSQNVIFYKTLKWIAKNYKQKNFRRLKLSNGRWGSEERTTFSVGYGHHFLWHKGLPLMLELEKDTGNQTEYDKESLVFTKLGRSKEKFASLMRDIELESKDDDKIKFYKFDNEWECLKEIKKRSLDSVFIESAKKNGLIKRLTEFIESEKWYIDSGIPYQLGILLYGPPGTGKTSFIKAIASHLNYPIYFIPASQLIKLERAFEKLTEKSIVVIEDIDCQTITHSRTDEDDNISKASGKNALDALKSEFSEIGLSEILNTIDGFCGVDGRILIATTNHIEKLDPALLRPGRFDIKFEMTHVTRESLTSFIRAYFPDEHFELDETMNVKPNVTIAFLQELVLQKATLEEIVKSVTS